MKPRIRPISNLYFKYGRAHGLEAKQVAYCLWDAGLIRMHEDKYEPLNESFTKSDYEERANTALYLYKKRVSHGL